jgi:hypothetical protein
MEISRWRAGDGGLEIEAGRWRPEMEAGEGRRELEGWRSRPGDGGERGTARA